MAEMDSASSTGVNLASDMRRRNVPHAEGPKRKLDGTEESYTKFKLRVCFLSILATQRYSVKGLTLVGLVCSPIHQFPFWMIGNL